MSLIKAIQAKDTKKLVAAVKAATDIYESAQPKDVKIDTVFGQVNTAAIIDEDTKWQVVATAYTEITNAAENIPASADRKVEIAKLIATNAILRNIANPATSDDGLL